MQKVNDYVVIKDEIPMIIYIILKLENEQVLLKGYTNRIIKVVSLKNIIPATKEQIEKEDIDSARYIKSNTEHIRSNTKIILGTILHIDGDVEYLDSCMAFYEAMNIHAWGIYIKEKEMAYKIEEILDILTPDILVITGHDAFHGNDKKDLANYENTNKYIDTLRVVRKRYNKDDLVVIVGACASHFEALIASGANFASSPGRINIHTYDPAVVASKVASTSCNKVINFDNVIKHIKNGRDAFGGIETKGKMRILY